jgi:hypothetical protein
MVVAIREIKGRKEWKGGGKSRFEKDGTGILRKEIK